MRRFSSLFFFFGIFLSSSTWRVLAHSCVTWTSLVRETSLEKAPLSPPFAH
jgi:hypothetical protein